MLFFGHCSFERIARSFLLLFGSYFHRCNAFAFCDAGGFLWGSTVFTVIIVSVIIFLLLASVLMMTEENNIRGDIVSSERRSDSLVSFYTRGILFEEGFEERRHNEGGLLRLCFFSVF